MQINQDEGHEDWSKSKKEFFKQKFAFEEPSHRTRLGYNFNELKATTAITIFR